jgi:UDP-N-acetylmuramyl pentapeptide phosphotransferase/UDP-N-acetylglucosamine-1-phosphate transferase
MSSDHSDAGPQKFHTQPTPRVGGFAIALGLITSYLVYRYCYENTDEKTQLAYLLIAAIPAFTGGFVEDLTKNVSVLKRLILSIVSAGLGAWLIGAVITHIGFAPVDWLLRWPLFSFLFTLFAVGGVVNAVNIIDGFNGIVSGISVLILLAIAIVSFQLQDVLILNASLAMFGALLGFMFWNYPHGRIFLGDGGSYLVGFWLAELVVLIVARHHTVSPWFAVLLLIHPVFETFFSVYRRKFLYGKSPWHPDGLHLHTLIFRRLIHMQWVSTSAQHKARCNSMTAPYFWVANLITGVLAVLFWDNSFALILSVLLFIAFYIWLYWRIVQFKSPRWLVKHVKIKSD